MKLKPYILLTNGLLFFFVFLLQNPVFSQRTISGFVSDANNGKPLKGVEVRIPNKKRGTLTDSEGTYKVTIPDNTTQLKFVYTENYGTRIIEIGTANELNVALKPKVSIGYGRQKAVAVTAAITQLDAKDFNQGIIADPGQLLQGKIAGLQIYNRGGNPNQSSIQRIRGLSTGGFAQPLNVIDGVVGASLQNVDPNDIESVTVLKDASATAIYGSRGSNGVILVTTKRGMRSEKIHWSYNGQVSRKSILNPINIMTPSEFLATGGLDLGSETDWIAEVTQQPINHNHSLAASGGIGKNTSFRLAANYRDITGTLRSTGFSKFNTRFNLGTTALEDKLKIDIYAAYSDLDQQIGYTEALRYAVFSNPTAPILGEDAPFSFNSDQFGGFYESLGLFDSFNPVSIVEQNKNEAKQNILNYNVNLSYDFTKKLTIKLQFAQQNIAKNTLEFAPTTANFLGNATSITRKGMANIGEEMLKFSLYESIINYDTKFANNNLQITAGYAIQKQEYSNTFVSLGDFQSNDLDFDDLNFDNFLESAQNFNNVELIEANRNNSPDNKNVSFFSRANFTFSDAVFVNASLRIDRTSFFNKRSVFPAISMGLDLRKYMATENWELFKVRLGYGVTSSLNNWNRLAQKFESILFISGSNGSINTQIINGGGAEDLSYEKKSEWNLGLEIKKNRFSGSIDGYFHQVKDLVLENLADNTVFGVDGRFENAGKLNTKGVEVVLGYEVLQQKKLTYRTGLIIATYHTKLSDYFIEAETRGKLGAPSQNGTNLILLKKGEKIGNIWGPSYQGVDVTGNPIFADINNDGNVIIGQNNALDANVDFKVLGNGLPTMELGWTNQMSLGDWSVNAFFRGAFGHSLVNTFRTFYEPRLSTQTSYNLVNTELAIPELTIAQFSSLYVEKANFLKLDNFSISRNFNFKNTNFCSAQVSFIITNAFVISNYTGTDPEPSIVDTDFDVFVSGIDRRNTYFPTRTIALGLKLGF